MKADECKTYPRGVTQQMVDAASQVLGHFGGSVCDCNPVGDDEIMIGEMLAAALAVAPQPAAAMPQIDRGPPQAP